MATPAYQYGALTTALETYVAQSGDDHYQKLFQPETGYLKCEGKSKTWVVTRAQPKDHQSLIDNIEAVRVGLQGQIASEIPNALDLIQRVNKVYCEALFGRGEIPVKKGVIGFNSRCKDVTKVLSNFFPTLLIFPDPITGIPVIFPDSESAYQAHKSLRLEAPERPLFSAPASPSPLQLDSPALPATPRRAVSSHSAPATPERAVPTRVGPEEIRHPRRAMPVKTLLSGESEQARGDAPLRALIPPSLMKVQSSEEDDQSDGMEKKEAQLTTEQFSKGSSPLRAKKLGGQSPLLKAGKKTALTNEMAANKYELMDRIVAAKLRANPFLVERLNRTKGAFLVEDTGRDSFWGGDPQDQSLRRQKPPITKNSQNVLGIILMNHRE